MTTVNAFQHDGFNGFCSAGYNARNGCGVPDLYIVTYDTGYRGPGNPSATAARRLVKINGNTVVWSVVIPGGGWEIMSYSMDVDVTVNANGIYTAVQNGDGSANIHRWDRDGNLLNSATFDGSVSLTICSNTYGDVYVCRGFPTPRNAHYDAELTQIDTFNTIEPTRLGNGSVGCFTRRSACAPNGYPYIAAFTNGAGGGLSYGRDRDFAVVGPPALLNGVYSGNNNVLLEYYGSAPSFVEDVIQPFGFAVSRRSSQDTADLGLGRGFELGLVSSDNLVTNTGPDDFTSYPAWFDMNGSNSLRPMYISTPRNLVSLCRLGTRLAQWIGVSGDDRYIDWVVETEDVFTDLPRDTNIRNMAYGMLTQAGTQTAYAWGISLDIVTDEVDFFVGQMNLTTQSQVSLMLNSNEEIDGLFGPSYPLGHGIHAAVIDQPGEGYSNPTVY